MSKAIAITKSRLEKEEEKLTVDDYVWESKDLTFDKGDSFDKKGFEFVEGDVFDLKTKAEVTSVIDKIKKKKEVGKFEAYKSKSGSTIYLLGKTKAFSLTSNAGWFSLSVLTHEKTVERIEKDKLKILE